MEPFVFSQLRRAMGLSIAEMARIIGLDGANASDRIREMERGIRPISGPLVRVLSYIAQAVDVEEAAASNLLVRFLPRWLDCSDLEHDTGSNNIIMHTRWPRFIGWLTDDASQDEQLKALLSMASVPVVSMNPDLGLGQLVVLYIDEPACDTQALIADAVRLKETRARRNLDL